MTEQEQTEQEQAPSSDDEQNVETVEVTVEDLVQEIADRLCSAIAAAREVGQAEQADSLLWHTACLLEEDGGPDDVSSNIAFAMADMMALAGKRRRIAEIIESPSWGRSLVAGSEALVAARQPRQDDDERFEWLHQAVERWAGHTSVAMQAARLAIKEMVALALAPGSQGTDRHKKVVCTLDAMQRLEDLSGSGTPASTGGEDTLDATLQARAAHLRRRSRDSFLGQDQDELIQGLSDIFAYVQQEQDAASYEPDLSKELSDLREEVGYLRMELASREKDTSSEDNPSKEDDPC